MENYNEKKAWKLNDEQKIQLLEWLAMFPSNRDVLRLMERHNFPKVTSENLSGYRKRYGLQMDSYRKQFKERAINRGWAVKDARVALMKDMLADWGSRKPDGKEVTEMTLKIEKQLSERVDDLAVQRVKLEFDSPKTMEDLMEGLDE